VRQDERKKIAAELTRLAEKLPGVNPKATTLDPWLRAHLYLQRMEDAYARFLELVQHAPEDFPDGARPYVLGQEAPYMGEGPYLGQGGKFEVLLLPSEAAHTTYLRQQFGLGTRRSQRWNVPERGTLSVTIHEAQGRLRVDTAMHGHVAFNLGHLFLEGFKHYSYDMPRWLQTGLAHWFEREVLPLYNSFDGDEGSAPEVSSKTNWEAEARKLVATGNAPRLTEMIRFTTYGSFRFEHHVVCWSIVDWLIAEHPDALASILRGMKGLLDEHGIADGSRLADVQRELFREHLGMGYLQLDQAWGAWVAATY
jgi:hypothetical protein